MTDTMETRDASNELDRFAQLWREAAEEDGGLGLPTVAMPRALVIRAERV